MKALKAAEILEEITCRVVGLRSGWKDRSKGYQEQREKITGEFLTRFLEKSTIREALEDMVCQFGYWSEQKGGSLCTGGLSSLEFAFNVLGWEDPHPMNEMACDEKGCSKQRSCGTPTPGGYRCTCGDHRPNKKKGSTRD